MPDDDWAIGQNEIDVRNESRRISNQMPLKTKLRETANVYLQDGPGMGTLLALPDLPSPIRVPVNTERGVKLAEYRKTAGVRLGERLYKFTRFVADDEVIA